MKVGIALAIVAWYNAPAKNLVPALPLETLMKKLLALAVIAAGVYAAATLKVEIKVSHNAANACESSCD